MHIRRILLAFSLAASAASVAFADLVQLNPNDVSTDRIEQLTRTLAQGSYADSDDIDIPAATKVSVKLRTKTVELNNESLAKNMAQAMPQIAILTVHILGWFRIHYQI